MNTNSSSSETEMKVATDPVSIKDIVVADPSVSFTFDLGSSAVPVNGVYYKNFKVKIKLDNLNPDDPTALTKVGTVTISELTQTSGYIYIPFGDSDYIPGTKFKLKLTFSADDSTGKSVDLDSQTFQVFGSGIAVSN